MASVALKFLAPDDPDITRLYIYESDTLDGLFSPIEVVDDIGDFPNYIREYTTNLANDENNWFSIQWEDTKGAKSDPSIAVQGRTDTLIGEIVQSMQLLDPNIGDNAAAMIARATAEKYFGRSVVAIDPETVSSSKLYGLALFSLASYHMVATSLRSGTAQKWVAGLVSMDSGSSSSQASVDPKALFNEAARWLGVGGARVAQMEAVVIAGGFSSIVAADISRLLVEVE